MSSPIRIAFVGRFYWHNGSSHALLGYARAAQRLGYDLRVSALGIVDEVVSRAVPLADVDWKPDLMVFVFEERFLKPSATARIERLVPRSRRLVIDPDGKYFPVTTFGIDTNHESSEARSAWVVDFERLSDVILQPCLGPVAPGAQRFLYFGVDRHRARTNRSGDKRAFDVVYVGNNWYRWHDMVWFFGGLAPIRHELGRLAVFGQYWDGEPLIEYEEHTYSDPEFFRSHGVECFPSVPYDQVELTMARGRISPIFLRPILNTLQLVTPRMFETFAADTVPILPPYAHHAAALYGSEVLPLCLGEDPAEAIQRILDSYSEHAGVAHDISEKLAQEHSYEVRIAELMEFAN